MNPFGKTKTRIAKRLKLRLKSVSFDCIPWIHETLFEKRMQMENAILGITPFHPPLFHINDSMISGSYFLGRCSINRSMIIGSQIRGDELKSKGDLVRRKGSSFKLSEDETIRIDDTLLIRSMIHNHSHDPRNPADFFINDTAVMHYSNIHGSPVDGCFLKPFSTIDLTGALESVIGNFAYVQTDKLKQKAVENGVVWIRKERLFEFIYRFPQKTLNRYISWKPGEAPKGIFISLSRIRERHLEAIRKRTDHQHDVDVPEGSSVHPYAVLVGKNRIGNNVLVTQSAFLEEAMLGNGSNAQENCTISNSWLEGNNVTAHGARLVHARLGKGGFVGFNAFLRGTPKFPLVIGEKSIVMPHTIVDLKEPLRIPSNHLIWGYIAGNEDLKKHAIPIEFLSTIKEGMVLGRMRFIGSGKEFIRSFQERIEHILEENGAHCAGRRKMGHAQRHQNPAFQILRPYPTPRKDGFFPNLRITG